jgi:hypothetical protein
MKTIDMGNNETRPIGISDVDADGYYTALTLSQSKRFRTRTGAEKWLARRGYAPTGEKIAQ